MATRSVAVQTEDSVCGSLFLWDWLTSATVTSTATQTLDDGRSLHQWRSIQGQLVSGTSQARVACATRVTLNHVRTCTALKPFVQFSRFAGTSQRVFPSFTPSFLVAPSVRYCGADCEYPFATDHGGDDGSCADYSTGVRAESYGGTDRRCLHSSGSGKFALSSCHRTGW